MNVQIRYVISVLPIPQLPKTRKHYYIIISFNNTLIKNTTSSSYYINLHAIYFEYLI